ncbi:ECF RNA polymerase sigma factor SigD [Anaerolineae bacterium]|nr:ECF RNA polymerase sigma factor SigD [Anaerolineae bacterium]
MRDSSDAELITHAQRGEVNAIGRLYDRHRESVFRYLWLRLDDRQLAEDLTGDVFMRMLDALPRYRLQGLPFRAWLYRIAHNLLIDYFRKMNHQTTVPIEIAEELETDDDPGRTIEQVLLTERLQAVLLRLEPTQCEVIVLRFLAGLSLRETAQTLGKTEAAIKALQHRGLSGLRRALEPLEEPVTS